MKKKILVVDDEKDLVEMLKMRLEGSGYSVITAFDGEAGLELAKKEMPDIILLDLMMPKKDGYEVCGELKKDNKYKKIPILILSAKGQGSDRTAGIAVGADGYVVKPFEGAVLLTKIKELLARK